MIKYLKIVFCFLLINTSIFSQGDDLNLGIQLGAGSISGNFIPVTTINPAVFLNFSIPFSQPVFYKLKFAYHRNAEFYLSTSKQDRYFAYLLNFSLCASYQYLAARNILIEQGVGPLISIDRTFSDLNETDTGIDFYAEIKIKTSRNPEGSYFGGGFEYGGTFTNTTVSFTNFYLKYQF